MMIMLGILNVQEATREAYARNVEQKDEEIHQLKHQLHQLLDIKAQEKQQLEEAIAVLQDRESTLNKKVCLCCVELPTHDSLLRQISKSIVE